MEKLYSVGQIAKIFHVARSTVIRWIHKGELKSFQTRGGDNRIQRKDLVVFMNAHNIPIDVLDKAFKKRILIIDDDELVLNSLGRILSKNEDYEVKTATNSFEAGFITREFKPHIIILDIMLKETDSRKIIDTIKNSPETEAARVIGISGVIESTPEEMADLGFDAYLEKPVSATTLETTVKELLPKERKFSTKTL